jgi:hypothetical protein
MRRYTTPTLKLIVPLDITGADIRVSIKQSSHKILKIGSAVTAVYDSRKGVTELAVSFTQEETGMFSAGGQAQVQVNWIKPNGDRGATDIETINVTENLLNEVISYGN